MGVADRVVGCRVPAWYWRWRGPGCRQKRLILIVGADVQPDAVADVLVDTVNGLVVLMVVGTGTDKLLASPGRFGAG